MSSLSAAACSSTCVQVVLEILQQAGCLGFAVVCGLKFCTHTFEFQLQLGHLRVLCARGRGVVRSIVRTCRGAHAQTGRAGQARDVGHAQGSTEGWVSEGRLGQ